LKQRSAASGRGGQRQRRPGGASREGRFRAHAVTVAANTRSWGLMERLGMQCRRDLDFDHAEGHPLRPHITYVIERPARIRKAAAWNGRGRRC